MTQHKVNNERQVNHARCVGHSLHHLCCSLGCDVPEGVPGTFSHAIFEQKCVQLCILFPRSYFRLSWCKKKCITVRAVDPHWRFVINATARSAGDPAWSHLRTATSSEHSPPNRPSRLKTQHGRVLPKIHHWVPFHSVTTYNLSRHLHSQLITSPLASCDTHMQALRFARTS